MRGAQAFLREDGSLKRIWLDQSDSPQDRCIVGMSVDGLLAASVCDSARINAIDFRTVATDGGKKPSIPLVLGLQTNSAQEPSKSQPPLATAVAISDVGSSSDAKDKSRRVIAIGDSYGRLTLLLDGEKRGEFDPCRLNTSHLHPR